MANSYFLIPKVVLVRVDHNCVKDGVMTDAFRVDSTLATLYNIVERGVSLGPDP